MPLHNNVSVDELGAMIEQRISEWMEQAEVVGLSVALVHSSEGASDPVVWQRGSGSRTPSPGRR